jgi:hypothetical protein
METRQVTEIKTYKLCLNPMRGRTEETVLVAISFDKQKLINFYNEELAPEPYSDKGTNSFSGTETSWYKAFKRGSDLEWFNPCYDGNFTINHHGQGIQEEWVNEEIIKQVEQNNSHKIIK